MSDQLSTMHAAISGALKSCIDTHGPITRDLIPSATKRVVGALTAEYVRCEVRDGEVAYESLAMTDE